MTGIETSLLNLSAKLSQNETELKKLSKSFQTLETQFQNIETYALSKEETKDSTDILVKNIPPCPPLALFISQHATFSNKFGKMTCTPFYGSLFPLGISKQGLDWLSKNFVDSKNDILVHMFPKVSYSKMFFFF